MIGILSPYPEALLRELDRLGLPGRVLEGHWDIQAHGPGGLIVSFGYRRIVPADILQAAPCPVINLHISFLPYNRGAHPNVWSALEGTPGGVSIHEIDSGVDTGPVYRQIEMAFDESETLQSSHQKLLDALIRLFGDSLPEILDGRCRAKPQPAGGSFHRSQDLDRIWNHFSAGWDTPLREVRALGSSLGHR